MRVPIEVSPNEVQARIAGGEELLLVDCREQDEFDTAHITGARLVPMSEIATRIAELTPWRAKPVVVYCHMGVRSLRVANWLAEQKFESVQSMSGGIDAWSVEVDPSVPRY